MLGGYGFFGSGATASKSFADLPNHEYLSLAVRIFSIDSWDSESFYISLDDVVIYEQEF